MATPEVGREPTVERIAALLALGDPFLPWSRERRWQAAAVLWRRFCPPKAWTRRRIAEALAISPSRVASLESAGLVRLADAFFPDGPDDRLDPRSRLGRAVCSIGGIPAPEPIWPDDPDDRVEFEGPKGIEFALAWSTRQAASRLWYDPPPRTGRAVLVVESFDLGLRGLLMLPQERADATPDH